MNKIAIYPGSFDPITNGHVDIIERSLKIFDKIIIGVLENPEKEYFFSTEERVNILKRIFKNRKEIEIEPFCGLLVDFVKSKKARVVIRGLRAISDFEYEFQMALMNRKLNPEIETFFMMPSIEYSYLSSRLVKEVYSLGGCIKNLVPPIVEEELKKKIKKI